MSGIEVLGQQIPASETDGANLVDFIQGGTGKDPIGADLSTDEVVNDLGPRVVRGALIAQSTLSVGKGVSISVPTPSGVVGGLPGSNVLVVDPSVQTVWRQLVNQNISVSVINAKPGQILVLEFTHDGTANFYTITLTPSGSWRSDFNGISWSGVSQILTALFYCRDDGVWVQIGPHVLLGGP